MWRTFGKVGPSYSLAFGTWFPAYFCLFCLFCWHSFSISSSHFILGVPMFMCCRQCLCKSSRIPIVILNGNLVCTCFFTKQNSPCLDQSFANQKLTIIIISVLLWNKKHLLIRYQLLLQRSYGWKGMVYITIFPIQHVVLLYDLFVS